MGHAVECEAVRSVGWAEDQGRREEMEDGWVFVDSFGGRPTSAFFGVYDGHGGRETVEYVTTRLHEGVLEALRKNTTDVEAALTEAFTTTDQQMRTEGRQPADVMIL